MDKIKEVINDPARLDEELKKFFAKIDKDNRGYITHEELKAALEETARRLNLPKPEKNQLQKKKSKLKKLLIQMELVKLLLKITKNYLWLLSLKVKKEVNFKYYYELFDN